jgi:NADPH:quinone reductase
MSIHDPYARPSMRALVQQSARGPADLVLVTDQPRPEPGPDEYLIRVVAAGVNFADVMQTRGTYVGGPHPPYVAGFEGAGEIVAIGSAVRDPYPVGTHVIGTGPGAFAEYMVMPAATAVPVPAGWPDAAALGLVLNWATALARCVRWARSRPVTSCSSTRRRVGSGRRPSAGLATTVLT